MDEGKEWHGVPIRQSSWEGERKRKRWEEEEETHNHSKTKKS